MHAAAEEVEDVLEKVPLSETAKKDIEEAVLIDDPNKVTNALQNNTELKEFVKERSRELKDVAASQNKKLTWEEVLARFKRGNDFNRKAGKDYLYNEISLGNGKRLDSYVPGEKIVSRKATDLKDIKFETLENYLKEMEAKYPPGTPINSPKYGDELKGKVLEGKMVLEIPESNQSFPKMQEYEEFAKKNYNITIEYKPE